ncbi:hypothetical protein LXA43DRAFT_1062454 [Ganoderma leucocontextum]|nr:hypothetical protein LXA43DRAFT_1062454 [Ganoderma leucocontextum]
MAHVKPTSHDCREPPYRLLDIRKHNPGPLPSMAFGFTLDDQSRRCWAQELLECHYDSDKLSSSSSEDHERLLQGFMVAVNAAIPWRVYYALPDLPRLRHRLLPVADDQLDDEEPTIPGPRYVFVLKDDSSAENLNPPLTTEHINSVRKFLDLGKDQQPCWVPIERCVETAGL